MTYDRVELFHRCPSSNAHPSIHSASRCSVGSCGYQPQPPNALCRQDIRTAGLTAAASLQIIACHSPTVICQSRLCEELPARPVLRRSPACLDHE
jgi:hypothetical protein